MTPSATGGTTTGQVTQIASTPARATTPGHAPASAAKASRFGGPARDVEVARAEPPARRRPHTSRRALSAALPTAALLALVLALWEVAVRVRGVPGYLLPAPSMVAARFAGDPAFFLVEGAVTLAEALAGLLVGGGLALGAGLLMARWRWLERALLPVAIVAKVTPIVIVAPLFVLWFGFGVWPRVLIAALLTFFPILVGAVSGLRAVPPAARDVFLTLDATMAQEALWLRVPAALPQLFAAAKVSSTLALLGAVIAEWVGGDRGLGRAVLLANTNLDTTTALAGVATIAAIGMGLIGALTLAERRLLFWHSERR
ncbi:MAG: ABC transporter permease [Chloroflexi bacterium]|nr:ABC transporter permease [Chloroflexota bacterium]